MLTLLPPRMQVAAVRSHAPLPRWRGPSRDRCFWWTEGSAVVRFSLQPPLKEYGRGPKLRPVDEVELWVVLLGAAVVRLWSGELEVEGARPIADRVVQVGRRYFTRYGEHDRKEDAIAYVLSASFAVDLPTAHIWANRGWLVGRPLRPAVFVGLCWNGIHTGYDGCDYCERIAVARRRRDRLRWRR